MNTKNKKILVSFFFLLIFFLSANIIFSQRVNANNFQYTPMESIPGSGNSSSFPDYIKAIYKFGIWTVGIAAMLMISVGGFMYLTSAGNTSKTGQAKEIITDAIIGVILALVSWLLLYTINPDLVKNSSKATINTSITP